MKNEDLGYSAYFQKNRNRLGFSDLSVARVISEHKGVYKIKNEDGEFLAKITGKQIFKAVSREDFPAVGDWVVITELNHDQAVIHSILPRLTIIKRRYGDKNKKGKKNETQIIATNIDIAFVVESVDRDYNLNRFERYFSLIESGGAKPSIILNKTDILSREELDDRKNEINKRFPNADVIYTSTINNDGLDELKNYITKGKTYCFLGSSGVGKSSLINKLLDGNVIKTGEVSSYSDRGKHTTTARQMYFLESGGILVDNPGMREVDVTEAAQGVHSFFDEILSLSQNCKYVDCTHTHEDSCAVVQAVKSGKLEEEKYLNYLRLKNETEYDDMSGYEKRERDRQFGKFMKRTKKELKDIGYKDF